MQMRKSLREIISVVTSETKVTPVPEDFGASQAERPVLDYQFESNRDEIHKTFHQILKLIHIIIRIVRNNVYLLVSSQFC